MSIAADVVAYLATAVPALPAITEDNFSPTGDALMVRGDPSSAVVKEFIDGSYQGTQQLTFYARNQSAAVAQSQLESVRAALDKEELDLTVLIAARVRSISTVSFVSQEETGESIYSTTVVVDYDGQNPIGG